MQDTPDRSQLLAAVRGFLKRDVAAAITDPALRFRVLVAANIVGVVDRELAGEQGHWHAEVDRLASLDPSFDADAARLIADRGERHALASSTWDRLLETGSQVDETELMAAVRATLADKLAVVNPRFDLSVEIE